jgi:hypothetical protein
MEHICHCEFDASMLITKYPAKLKNPNKKIVFEISCPPGATHSGTITFSRWHQMPLPETLTRNDLCPRFDLREDYFTYETPPEERVDWHLNFAHYDLFCAYGGPLFAQDEMQVAEHPALASLRHALIDSGIKPLTVEDGIPTPALIMGVERRCIVETNVDPVLGRLYGLYGNHFNRASEEVIRQATKVIEPPTISNILAMEALAYSTNQLPCLEILPFDMEASVYGTAPSIRYTQQEIEFILSTAITGFSAAVRESKKNDSAIQVAIHTGFWGCGAYGGNRILMPLLQMIAACCSDLDILVFHSPIDSMEYYSAIDLLEKVLPIDQPVKVNNLISQVESIGFEWGISDGN